jgi:hypothetical protein
MVATGIKATHIKVPMIVGHQQQVSLDEFALPPGKSPHEALVIR